jgi:hypothetical protein
MKTGRNQPCPCGSGKKYKNCCQAKQAERSARRSSYALWILGALVVLGIAGLLSTIMQNRDESRRVWSTEHGHWHNQ